jgi:hypothetical protein
MKVMRRVLDWMRDCRVGQVIEGEGVGVMVVVEKGEEEEVAAFDGAQAYLEMPERSKAAPNEEADRLLELTSRRVITS